MEAKALKTEMAGSRSSRSLLPRVLIGLLLGLAVIQLLQLGWLLAALVLGATVAFVVALNSYVAWSLLMVACAASTYKYARGEVDIRPEHVVLVFTMFGWLLALLAGKVRLHKVPMLLPLLAYLVVNVISSIMYSPDSGASARGLGLIIANILVYVITVNVLGEHQDKLKVAVKLLLVVGVVQVAYAFIALISYYGGGPYLGGLSFRQVEGATSLQGFLEEPNFLAAFAASIALVYLALLTGRGLQIRKGLLIAGFACMVIVLPMTYTRAAWLGFMMGFLLLIFMQKPKSNIFNPRTATIMVVILIVAVVSLPIISSFTKILSDQVTVVVERAGRLVDFGQGSGKGRVLVQNVAMEHWHSAVLIGNGTMSFPPDIPELEYASSGAWLYSSNIQALHDSGLVGLIFLIWAQGGILLVIVRGYRNAKDPFYKASLAGFIAGIIALIIASQASSFYFLGYPWVFSGLAVAISSAVGKKPDKSNDLQSG